MLIVLVQSYMIKEVLMRETSTAWSLILAVVQWIHQRKNYFIALRLSNTTLGMGNGLLVHSHPWIIRRRAC